MTLAKPFDDFIEPDKQNIDDSTTTSTTTYKVQLTVKLHAHTRGRCIIFINRLFVCIVQSAGTADAADHMTKGICVCI